MAYTTLTLPKDFSRAIKVRAAQSDKTQIAYVMDLLLKADPKLQEEHNKLKESS